jgi:cation:H+ antiporter
METAILKFALSALVIVIAGTTLTRYADAIAELTKLGRLLVGSIFLAAATSLPELAVDVSAARLHLPDIAVGDLFGSCLFNLLILGVLDLTHHSRGRLLSRSSAAHALSGTASISLMAVAGIAVFSRVGLAVGPWGIGSLAVGGAYLLTIRLTYYDEQFAARQQPGEVRDARAAPQHVSLRHAVIGYVIAAGVILAAAPVLAGAADEIATHTGLGRTFVGTTMVALSTSLPELVTTFTAIRLSAFDLALGNIFGSNAFNMGLLAVVDLAYSGPLLAEVSPVHALTCFSAILVTAVAVLGQLYRVESRTRLLEPDAWIVILLVLGTLALIYYSPTA